MSIESKYGTRLSQTAVGREITELGEKLLPINNSLGDLSVQCTAKSNALRTQQERLNAAKTQLEQAKHAHSCVDPGSDAAKELAQLVLALEGRVSSAERNVERAGNESAAANEEFNRVRNIADEIEAKRSALAASLEISL